MEKKARNILFIIILLLVISNVILLATLYLRPNLCSKCSAPVEKPHEKSYHKNALELLDLTPEQTKEINLIWKDLKADGSEVMDSINYAYKQLITEVSSDTPNNVIIDSLETEIAKNYKVLLHQTTMAYPNAIKNLNEDQVRVFKCLYFDLFLRIHNVPLDDIYNPSNQ